MEVAEESHLPVGSPTLPGHNASHIAPPSSQTRVASPAPVVPDAPTTVSPATTAADGKDGKVAGHSNSATPALSSANSVSPVPKPIPARAPAHAPSALSAPSSSVPASAPAQATAPVSSFPAAYPQNRAPAAPQQAGQGGGHGQTPAASPQVPPFKRPRTKIPQPPTPLMQHYQKAQQSPDSQPARDRPRQATTTRYVIKEPPSSQALSPAARLSNPSSGFPSPTRDYAREDPKFVDDTTRLACAIQQSLPEAVRHSIRDNWQKCLMGSEFHQAFVLNTSLHHSIPASMQRTVRDFGAGLVAHSKHELIKHFQTKDLDDVAEHIISVASNEFLDKCLEKRLLTVEAKPLIQALARAERLGYETSDIVEEGNHERVIPGAASYIAGARPGSEQKPQQPPPQNTAAAQSRTFFQCHKCFRVFHNYSPFHYPAPSPSVEGFQFACQYCGQGFVTIAGVQYHNNNKVCGEPQQTPPAAAGIGNAPGARSSEPAPSGSQLTATPDASKKQTQYVEAAQAASAASIGPGPYAHLSPERHSSLTRELRETEEAYTIKFREAESLPDPIERRSRLESLRNNFQTRQSLIRRKYGVRLRERRTKAEIEAERVRMGVSGPARPSTRGSMQPGRPASTPTVTPAKRPGGWIAANDTPTPAPVDVDSHDTKRRRVDEGPGNTSADNPRAKSHTPSANDAHIDRLTVSSISGGLGASAATAARHDPSVVQHERPGSSGPAASRRKAGVREADRQPGDPSPAAAATLSSGAGGADAARRPSSHYEPRTHPIHLSDGADSGSDSEDDDIPARLPARVRLTLTPKAKPDAGTREAPH